VFYNWPILVPKRLVSGVDKVFGERIKVFKMDGDTKSNLQKKAEDCTDNGGSQCHSKCRNNDEPPLHPAHAGIDIEDSLFELVLPLNHLTKEISEIQHIRIILSRFSKSLNDLFGGFSGQSGCFPE